MLSRFEEITRQFFRKILPQKPIYNSRPDWLKYRTGFNLELDIFYPTIRLAIECNGFGHKERYQKQKDKFKSDKCKENGIVLITVTHPARLLKRDVLEIIGHTVGKRVSKSHLPYSLVRSMKRYKPHKIKRLKFLERKIKLQERKIKLQEYEDIQNKETEGNKRRRAYQEQATNRLS